MQAMPPSAPPSTGGGVGRRDGTIFCTNTAFHDRTTLRFLYFVIEVGFLERYLWHLRQFLKLLSLCPHGIV